MKKLNKKEVAKVKVLSLLNVGVLLMGVGATMLTQMNWYGLILVGVSAVVFWLRDKYKLNGN